MKSRSSLFRGQSAIAGTLALCAAVAAPASSSAADWLDSIQDARCAAEDIEGVTSNVRNAIEASVRRAEMSIQAPTPVGDLGCLNDLMTAPLDIFSNIGGLLGSLQSGLGNLGSSALNIDIDVSGMICGFAATKFAQLTQPLTQLDKTMSGYASLAATADDRVNGVVNAAFTEITEGAWDNSSSGSTTASGYGGYTGIVSASDSSGYSGSIDDYTLPDLTPSVSDVEDVPYTLVSDVVVDNSDQWNEYNQRLMQALGQYVGCRVAGELDGTQVSGSYYGAGTWNVPGHISECSFNPGGWPVVASASASAPAAKSTVSGTAARPSLDSTADRVGGQERAASTASSSSGSTEQGSNTIWDMLGN